MTIQDQTQCTALSTGDHPAFPQPADADCPVWRYIDISKLIAMLGQQALFLARLDTLGDPHEGSVTRPFCDMLETANPEAAERHVQWRANFRKNAFVSCWRWDHTESEAMWRIYCGSNQGVAIRTTYARLSAAASGSGFPNTLVGMITYTNYEVGKMPDGLNLFHPIMHKREAFRHEQEVRVVCSMVGLKYSKDHTVFGMNRHGQDEPIGLLLPWNPEEVIEKIYINPYAEEWYGDVVKTTIEKFSPKLAGCIEWSTMRAEPYY